MNLRRNIDERRNEPRKLKPWLSFKIFIKAIFHHLMISKIVCPIIIKTESQLILYGYDFCDQKWKEAQEKLPRCDLKGEQRAPFGLIQSNQQHFKVWAQLLRAGLWAQDLVQPRSNPRFEKWKEFKMQETRNRAEEFEKGKQLKREKRKERKT